MIKEIILDMVSLIIFVIGILVTIVITGVTNPKICKNKPERGEENGY